MILLKVFYFFLFCPLLLGRILINASVEIGICLHLHETANKDTSSK